MKPLVKMHINRTKSSSLMPISNNPPEISPPAYVLMICHHTLNADESGLRNVVFDCCGICKNGLESSKVLNQPLVASTLYMYLR